MTDPIADLLTRIRNGVRARHETVTVPTSRLKEEIVKLLVREGYLERYIKEDCKPQGKLVLFLKFVEKFKPVIHKITRISRPGGRVYKGYQTIRPSVQMGLTILSTPQGVITHREARKLKVGGEVLCEVW